MELSLTLDRIEEGIAVLLVRPEESVEIYWPVEALPEGVSEGDVLAVTVHEDNARTEDASERVRSLLEKLQQRNQGQ